MIFLFVIYLFAVSLFYQIGLNEIEHVFYKKDLAKIVSNKIQSNKHHVNIHFHRRPESSIVLHQFHSQL